MGFDLTNFRDPHLDAEYLAHVVSRQSHRTEARFERLWNYFRNPLLPAVGPAAEALNGNSRPYLQAQEVGLPARITGVHRGGISDHLTDLRRKEVVIENDIGWRVQTMVEFLFGRRPMIRSLAADPRQARTVETVLAHLLEANGGLAFLQELALLGAVFGFVDVALRTPAGDMSADSAELSLPPPLDEPVSPPRRQGDASASDGRQDDGTDPAPARSNTSLARAIRFARTLRLETIEAGRVLPILDENDYRRVRYWVQRFEKHPPRLASQDRPWWRLGRGPAAPSPETVEVVEILGPTWWQRYENGRLAVEGPNALGRLPVVHIPNLAVPGAYEGLSDVEPLIPLQDELNTRLSDRAHRVTYQSFRMYLGKGIDDFLERPVGPGQMWATTNIDASIQEFGADSGSPSEDAHIDQVRQAMDKVSGVTPLAAGLIRGNVGNLTSAAALKVVLAGLLARTARKRLTYGEGLQRIVEMSLAVLDRFGALRTAPADRRVEIHWPSPLPSDESEQLRNAQIKAQLGVPAERILAELGYGPENNE